MDSSPVATACRRNALRAVTAGMALFLSIAHATAGAVTLGFSGTIAVNDLDVPAGSIFWGVISWHQDAPLLGDPRNIPTYPIERFELHLGSEMAAHTGGRIRIDGTRITFDAGPHAAGGGGEYSGALAGITLRGAGIEVSDIAATQLPTLTAADFIGKPGRFYVNRSRGDLFDLDLPAQLRIPSPAPAVPEPSTLALTMLAAAGSWFRGSRARPRNPR